MVVIRAPSLRQAFQGFFLSDLIVRQQASGHISGQGVIFPGLGVFDTHAQTVRVGVCGKHQIRVHLFCQLQSQGKGFLRLRIGVAHRGEFPVRQFLLFYYIDMIKAQFLQHAAGGIFPVPWRGVYTIFS